MYHTIVKRIVRNGFANMSNGNYEAVLKMFAPDVKFKFYGDHALGETASDLQRTRAWFAKMFRIFPGIQFQVTHVFVQGLPWNTEICTHLRISLQLADGTPYENVAIQFVRLKWGRIYEDYVLEDTQKLVGALAVQYQNGIADAK